MFETLDYSPMDTISRVGVKELRLVYNEQCYPYVSFRQACLIC